MTIKDSVIIVTGASSGIGLATAQLLAKQGAKVVLAARNAETLQKISQNLPGSFVVPTDMTDEAAIQNLIGQTEKHFSRIDGLVNNAGRGYDATIEKINSNKYLELFKLNMLGPLLAMQYVVPIMKQQQRGAIVNISSGTSVMAIPGLGAYSSTKRALNGLSLTARAELAQDNIAVSLVYPGITATNFYGNKLEQSPHTSRAMYEAGDPPKKVAQLILQALQEGDAEYFAHQEMKDRG